jgi:uncharacterized protein YoxC
MTASNINPSTPPGVEIPTAPWSHNLPVMECGAAISRGQMEQFVQTFQQSTRRWEVFVYPALFAFVVLAGYGFFLIYSLTGDMTSMARSMDPNMGAHMQSMTESIVTLADNVQIMSKQVQIMTSTITDISVKLDTLPPMLQYLGAMEQSIANMVQSVSHMDNMVAKMDVSMTQMNQSIVQMDRSIGNMDKAIASMDNSIQTMNQSIRVITATTDQMRRDFTMMNHNVTNFSRPMSFANSFMPW